tara:strand:- start:3184 stop:3753 length:570 start_codon:yes stop_codon:yes gene_type:complete
MRYHDPLSEISPHERGPKWLLYAMSLFSEQWYRPFCAPFFIVGLFYIAAMFFSKNCEVSPNEKHFWFLVTLVCLSGLAIASLVGDRTSRAIFAIDPLIIAISMLGVSVIWASFPNFSKKTRKVLFQNKNKEEIEEIFVKIFGFLVSIPIFFGFFLILFTFLRKVPFIVFYSSSLNSSFNLLLRDFGIFL